MGANDDHKTDWSIVAAALLGGIIAALNVGKVPAALPHIRADMGLDLVPAGFVISVFNLLGMLLFSRALEGVGFICIAVAMPSLISGNITRASNSLPIDPLARIQPGVCPAASFLCWTFKPG